MVLVRAGVLGSDTTDVFKSQSAVFSDFFSDSLIYTVTGVDLGSKSGIWNLQTLGFLSEKNLPLLHFHVFSLVFGSL